MRDCGRAGSRAVKAAVDRMVDAWGGIDVCIPNAGLGIFSRC